MSEERSNRLRRVAMVSVHTSPLDQPGTGDAGGMNVYVLELSRRLAERDLEVEIYTRATSSRLLPVVDVAPGVRLHHVPAGPYEGLGKDELPAQLCTFARHLFLAEASHEHGWFDLVHSHYWLSGQVGALLRDRLAVPLVHTMHTMAAVKNAALAAGDTAEPAARVLGERQVVEAADMLVANTDLEAKQLIEFYDADATRVEVVPPGVDLRLFRPRRQEEVRARLGVPLDAVVPAFVGRLQPLKAPDVFLLAVAHLVEREPALRHRLFVPVIGGPSGSGLERPGSLAALAAELGISDLVRFVPPVTRERLAEWYAAADVVCLPSHSESFGLVALEAQASGTPVVAAAVGGLTTVVRNGRTGCLVEGHDPEDYGRAIGTLLTRPALRAAMAAAAAEHAREFAWERTAALTHDVYRRAASAPPAATPRG